MNMQYRVLPKQLGSDTAGNRGPVRLSWVNVPINEIETMSQAPHSLHWRTDVLQYGEGGDRFFVPT